MKVMIDPGHGGEDSGAAWGEKLDYVEEDDLNLIISFLLRYELQLAGYQVALTREVDKYITLLSRVIEANSWKADIFVSIHADAFHQTTARGMTIHVSPVGSENRLRLADRIEVALNDDFPTHVHRERKFSPFFVLQRTRMPAVLIESEFISNPNTRRFLKEPENQLKIAKAVATGIQQYS